MIKKISIPFVSKSFFAYEHFKHSDQNILLTFPDDESAFKAYKQMLFFCRNHNFFNNQNLPNQVDNFPQEDVLFFPSLDTIPYDRVSPGAEILSKRANILTKLAIAKIINSIKENDVSEVQKDNNKFPTYLPTPNKKILITSAHNIIAKYPPIEYFATNTVYLKSPKSSIKNTYDPVINMRDLIGFLLRAGFSRAASAIDSGEFAVRGEIIDIVTRKQDDLEQKNPVSASKTNSAIKTNNPGLNSESIQSEARETDVVKDTGAYRINFGFDGIESIKSFDVDTQISTHSLDEIIISPATESMLNENTILNFKNNFLKIFGVNHSSSAIYESVTSGIKFQGYEHLSPLLFDDMVSIFDYIPGALICDDLSILSAKETHRNFTDFYESRIEANKSNFGSIYYAIPPEKFTLTEQQFDEKVNQLETLFIQGYDSIDPQIRIEQALRDNQSLNIYPIERPVNIASKEGRPVFDVLVDLIFENKEKIPVIFCSLQSNIERIKTALNNLNCQVAQIESLSEAKKNIVNLTITPLASGVMNQDYLFISEQDIWGEKFSSATHRTSKQKLSSLLAEIDNIEEGELVVHSDHGIGRFDKIETIIVQGSPHDCLKIIYAENDILYLPVEDIDSVKKFGSTDAQLDKLGGLAWQKRKSKIKNRIKDIASSLIKITAQRALQIVEPHSFDKEAYDQFCNKFPYNETEDQLNAIQDIIDDLHSGKLLDRLICGDVGFGKTEVAMRAAFMCAFDTEGDKPQIAVISPTTILCKQHYENFIERFRGFGLKIVQMSRLTKLKTLKQNKKDIADGKASIVIGTHALLSKDIEFKNLKMIIIDEEQHFGVAQKEKLKQLKVGVHVISLSATPIPRTLQMSMLGIKDLSLIATAPIDRLPVRTSVLPFDQVILRDALMRERFRGGRSFFVCPRIRDIEEVEKKMKIMVPELSYRIAHGQMPASTIDEVMSDFAEGKFDILLSTTIIESGIDIPSVNTIVIYAADKLGLSQLYQLRGRVGRGKQRGYAYLTISSSKKINKHSWQRLEVLQNIDSLGAGFTIASHDMDIRGFGNLVGDEQSGHIKEVGAELYHDMLDAAITELKALNSVQGEGNSSPENTTHTQDYNASINLGLAVSIPEFYVEDSALRLGLYRRIGKLKSEEEVESFKNEMIDRFGPPPLEVINLLEIVKIKFICYKLRITNLDSGPGGFVVKFAQDFDNPDLILNFIKQNPRTAKLKDEHKMVYVKNLNSSLILEETTEFLSKLSN